MFLGFFWYNGGEFLFKDYEMILYTILGVLFALSVLVAVLDKKISHGIFFFLFVFVLFGLLLAIEIALVSLFSRS